MAVQYMRKAILKKAHFDIMDLDTVQVSSMHHFEVNSSSFESGSVLTPANTYNYD